MERQFTRRTVLLAMVASLALGGCTLWDSHWGDDRPVTLLSKRVTLGPEPLVVRAPRGTSAWGSSFWLTVYLVREKVCEGDEWTKEEAKRLPVIQAVAVTSDGQRHSMNPSDCCRSNVCGALKLHGHTSNPDRWKRLVRLELSAPEPVIINRVMWRTGGMQLENLGS